MVDDDVATLMVVVLGVVGFLDDFVDLDAPGRMDGEVPTTVMVEPLMAVTLPEAKAKLAKPPVGKWRADVPLGASPPPKDGRVAPPDPPPPKRPNPPVPAPPNPPVQVPVDEAELIDTDVALIAVEPFFGCCPLTVTQDPTDSALSEAVAVCEKVVVDVQLTAVWPVLGFCTCMLVPETAATVPVAAEKGAEVVAAPAADDTASAETAARAVNSPALRQMRPDVVGDRISIVSPCFRGP